STLVLHIVTQYRSSVRPLRTAYKIFKNNYLQTETPAPSGATLLTRRNDRGPRRITPHMSSTLLDTGVGEACQTDAEALVAEAAAGREQGLVGLYDLYGRRAYGVALRVLGDETLAQDAVQDAFVTVWRSAAGYRPERTSPGAWLLMIVHRRAVDIARREEHRR